MKINMWYVLIGVPLLFQIPLLLAFLFTPEGYVFSGQVAWFDPWDINVYVSAIRWAQEFGWYYQNTYTTLSHQPILFYPFYALLGNIFRQSDPFVIYTIAKIPAGVFLTFSIYTVSKVFISDERKSLYATILASFAGGFGGLFYGTTFLPDISITPLVTYSAFEKPHEALALSFYVLSLSRVFSFFLHHKPRSLWISVVIFLPVIILYPYYILSYCLIVGVLFVLNRFSLVRIIITSAPIILVILPLGLLYSRYLLSSDGFSNVTSPFLGVPNIFLMLLGYGIFTAILLMGLIDARKDKKIMMLCVWFLIFLVAYTPLSFARYYLRGTFIPLSILTVLVYPRLVKLVSIKPKTLLLTLGFFMVITNVVIFVGRTARIWIDTSYYITTEEREALSYLNSVSQGSGVLSSYRLGNLVPAYSANRVYFGHLYQTPNSSEKFENLAAFYRHEMDNQEAYEFLNSNSISYVVWGTEERLLSENNELGYEFLKPVFENEGVTIYHYLPQN